MPIKIMTTCLIVLFFLGGCAGRFAANQGRKQAARSSDHYLKKYAEPQLAALYADDPDAQVRVRKISREGRNWLVDAVVNSRGKETRRLVLVNEQGRIIEERR